MAEVRGDDKQRASCYTAKRTAKRAIVEEIRSHPVAPPHFAQRRPVPRYVSPAGPDCCLSNSFSAHAIPFTRPYISHWRRICPNVPREFGLVRLHPHCRVCHLTRGVDGECR